MSAYSFTTISDLRQAIIEKKKQDDEKLAQFEKQRQTEENAKLMSAHESMTMTIYNSVLEAIEAAIYRNPDATYAIVVNPHLGANYEELGFHPLLIMRGKYNRQTGTYTRLPHQTRLPIEQVFDMLKDTGVTALTDISDRTKSFRIFYKVEF